MNLYVIAKEQTQEQELLFTSRDQHIIGTNKEFHRLILKKGKSCNLKRETNSCSIQGHDLGDLSP